MTKNVEHTPRSVAADMFKTFRLKKAFVPFLVYAPERRWLTETREALEAELGPIHFMDPSEGLFGEIQASLESYTNQGRRPVIWIQQPDFEASAWRAALPGLNFKRGWFEREQDVFLVLAGPMDLLDLIMDQASDLRSFAKTRFVHKADPPEPVEKLRWLHLAGPSFRKEDRWEQQDSLSSMRNKLSLLRDEGRAPELVFVTGDVAHSGKEKEYDRARHFFSELAEILDLEPRYRWFIVPGFKDIDQMKVHKGDALILDHLSSQDDLFRIFEDRDTMALI
ncbi:MAG: hypothetical protein MI867_07325, partial [Pseudomonadales bacterium]|nr:hypothetical protein [Pseudomonadales bacterium]